ncbi:hypothetical protein [Rickettsiella endosymbiont of Xylota segnis]|uniref:hypothetical protein n=1 Tax=Rickettsiella endosymbiont of Xylota segnis TaxID=3066238 RepID=UPI0030CAC04F
MNKRSYKDLILVLIFKSNGEWSWYQIERALDLRGIGGRVNSVEAINTLMQEGLVKQLKTLNKNLSKYSVTEQGKIKVQQLIDKFGAESFTTTQQNPDDYEL